MLNVNRTGNAYTQKEPLQNIILYLEKVKCYHDLPGAIGNPTKIQKENILYINKYIKIFNKQTIVENL